MNPKPQQKSRKKWPNWAVQAAGWLPMAVLATAYLAGGLGFNPVESVLRWSGRTAVAFLLLSLACTPAHRIF